MEDFFSSPSATKDKLKVGDKVRFLNSVGGGVVTAFRGKDLVLVEDEDGFEVPVLKTECVVVGEADRRLENKEPEPYIPPAKTPADTSAKPSFKTPADTSYKPSFKTHVRKDEVPDTQRNKKTKPVEIPVDVPFEETPQGERLNLSLVFLPVEPKEFMQSPFEAYLVNESNYYLYFNYMSCSNNSWMSRFHGLIEPDTKLFLEEFQKSELNELEHVCLQLIAFKKGKPFSLKNPLSVEIRLDTVKFYKLHCFVKNDYFDEDALVIPVIIHDVPEKQMLVSALDIQAAMYDRSKDERCKTQPAEKINKHAVQPLEVDLHINQLIESTSGLSNADMLNYQLSKFHEVMKANSTKKGQRIVFIHGKGEGTLRTAIEKELKTAYKKQCRFQDASFREYGFGATMVTVF